MQCKKCGAELLQNAKFCVKCGSNVINEKNIRPALIGVMASVILLSTIFCVMGGVLHPMILVWVIAAGLVLLNIGIVWKVNKKHVVVSEEGELSCNEVNMLSHIFVSKDEKYIASIGNGYIVNFLLGKGLHKGFAVLSDKRVYFKGKCMSVSGKKLAATNEERTVDIANVTGQWFIWCFVTGVIWYL